MSQYEESLWLGKTQANTEPELEVSMAGEALQGNTELEKRINFIFILKFYKFLF